jgi:hypothetical protein
MVTEYLGTRGYRSPINSGETPHQVVKLRSPQKDSNLNKYDLQAWEDTASGELTQFTFKVFGSGATATIDKVERE